MKLIIIRYRYKSVFQYIIIEIFTVHDDFPHWTRPLKSPIFRSNLKDCEISSKTLAFGFYDVHTPKYDLPIMHDRIFKFQLNRKSKWKLRYGVAPDGTWRRFVFAIGNGTRFIRRRISTRTGKTTFSNCRSVQYHPQFHFPRIFLRGSLSLH